MTNAEKMKMLLAEAGYPFAQVNENGPAGIGVQVTFVAPGGEPLIPLHVIEKAFTFIRADHPTPPQSYWTTTYEDGEGNVTTEPPT